MRRSIAVLLLFSPVACSAQHAPIATAEPRSPLAGAAYETLRSLADEVGPRLAGSEGDRAAVAWGLAAMRAAGLANVHAEPVRVRHWERGAESGEIVAPVRQRLALAALGGSIATPPEGLEAPLLQVTSLAALRALPAGAATGHIVFINQPMERTTDGSGYGHIVDTRSFAPIAAARAGAVGVLVRSLGTDTNRLPHAGATRYDASVPRIPAAAVSVPDALLLQRLLASGRPVRVRFALGCATLPDADSANVVGEVPGTDASPQIVLLGAHLDAWDLGRGALDDGAGCAIVLTAARYVLTRSPRPRRTVRVVFFANEENGGAGSQAYRDAHRAEFAAHTVAIEADHGDGRVLSVRYLGAPARREAFARVASTLAPWGVTFNPREARGGADVEPLRGEGVPLVDLHQDMTRYFDLHHTANDVPEFVQRDDLEQSALVYGVMADGLARMEGDLGRAPPVSPSEAPE